LDTHIIPEAANRNLFYTERVRGGINEEPYLMFTGGFDFRKNLDGAAEAFSKAIRKYPENKALQKAKF
jgi:TolA-binding protein